MQRDIVPIALRPIASTPVRSRTTPRSRPPVLHWNPQRVGGVMDKGKVATATTSIEAGRHDVWRALVDRDALKAYMFGADVDSDWQEGSDIRWRGEMHGKRYEDKGKVLRAEPDRVLQYSHFSPMSGKPDVPANYHTVTIRLDGDDRHTEVSLSQDNNADETSRAESQKNWAAMLEGLKDWVERAH
jgi:uncharacterized protein YndB with AHSA1/START domain